MINVESYLSKQLSGPRTKTVVEGISAAFNRFWDYLVYLKNIGIESAYGAELDLIGTIMGYTWPLVPNNIILDKVFYFTSDVTIPSFSNNGFSGTGVDGGNFSSLDPLDSNRMSIAQYKQVLEAIAKYKWGKFSLLSIDAISQIFHATYDLYTDENGDISVVYKGLNQGGCQAYYPATGLSPYPDDPAGTTYIQDAWATVDGWAEFDAWSSLSVASGMLTCTASASGEYFLLSKTVAVSGKTIRCKIKSSISGSFKIIKNAGSDVVIQTVSVVANQWYVVDAYAVDGTIVKLQLAGTVVSGVKLDVDFVYIGTGKYLDGSLQNQISDSYDATIYGGVPDGAGKIIRDGLNDYERTVSAVTMPDIFHYHETWTIPNHATQIQVLFGVGSSGIGRLLIDREINTRGLRISYWNGTATVTIVLANFFDATTTELEADVEINWMTGAYIVSKNGVQFASGTFVAAVKPSALVWFFGNQSALPSTQFCGGSVANRRWFNRALTAQQVQDSINDPVGLKISNTNLYLVNRVFTDLFNTAPRVVATRI